MAKPGSSEELRVAIVVLRALRGWTQQQLADASGVNRVQISLFESGKRIPSARTLKRLLDAAGVPSSTFHVLLSVLRLAGAGQEAQTATAYGEGSEVVHSVSTAMRSARARVLSIAASPRERNPPESGRREALEAWQRLKAFSPHDRRVLVDGAPEYQTWALCELVCLESERAAANDPRQAIELAELAIRIADRVAGEESLRSQLQGYALAHRANARRVADDANGAEADFRRARELRQVKAVGERWWDQGIALDLEASLRKDQRRFAEALALQEQAAALASPERLGDILLNLATTLEQMGDVARSVEVLEKAAPHVDAGRSPRSFFGLRFNLAVNLVHLGRHEEAAARFPEVREMAVQLGNDLDLLRVRWLESRIAAGQGRRAEAVEALSEVRAGFLGRDLGYDTALATLELAVLYMEEGRTGEVKTLALEMRPIFQSQGVPREALAALRLFCEAAEREAITLEMARRLVQYFEQARRDPELRFTG